MRRLIPLMLSFALIACGKSIDLHDATVEQFTKAARMVDLRKPGFWIVESRVTAMDLGSTDPAMAPMLREQGMQPRTASVCVEKGRQDLMSFDNVPAFQTMACRIPRFTAKDGTIDGRITCTSVGGSLTMDEHGRYAAETYSLQMRVRQATQGQPTISTATQVDAHRTGDCPDNATGTDIP